MLFSCISWLFCKLWNSECLGATTKISGDFGINRDRNYIARFYRYVARRMAGALLRCALWHFFYLLKPVRYVARLAWLLSLCCKPRLGSQESDTTPIILNLTSLTPDSGKIWTKFQQLVKKAPLLK